MKAFPFQEVDPCNISPETAGNRQYDLPLTGLKYAFEKNVCDSSHHL